MRFYRIVRTDLICGECGYVLSIQRKENSPREFLHIKDLYCPFCQETTKFIELGDKDFSYFKLLNKEKLLPLEKHVLHLLEEEKHHKTKKLMK